MVGIPCTEAERDALAAVIGTGVLTVTYDGPPRRSVTYQDDAAMKDTLARMQRYLDSQAGSYVPTRLMATRKGTGW